jgi:hypothetical protein
MSPDWSVTITGPNGDVSPTVIRPPEPRWVPQVNDRPEVYIPVPHDPKYHDPSWENVPMDVAINGVDLPIDRLEEHRLVRDGPRRRKYSLLVGRGGSALQTEVQRRVEARPKHLVAEDLVTGNTGFVANVDVPDTTEESGVTIQQANDTAGFRTQLAEPLPRTSPVKIQNDELTLRQSSWIREAENGVSDADGTVSDSNFSGGSGIRFANEGDRVRVSFSNDYTIPAGEAEVVIRLATQNPISDFNGSGIRISLDGHTVGRKESGWGETDNARWDYFSVSAPVEPGVHTITLEQTTTQTESTGIDVVGLVDSRYDYSFPKTVGSNGYLAGPEKYPDAVDVLFQYAEIFRAVASAQLQISVDSVQGEQLIGLLADGGETGDVATNATSLTVSYDPAKPTVQPAIRLSRHGDQSGSTPTTGVNATTVSSIEVTATLTDLPLVIDREFSGRLDDVLTELLGDDFVWAVETDSGSQSIEVTQPGQRVAASQPTRSRIELEQDAGAIVEQATVEGGRQSVQGERVTATTGSAVGFDTDRLRSGSESVYSPKTGPSDTYEEYTKGVDYSIDYQDGTITALSGGAIADGEVVSVDYEFTPSATFTAEGVSNPAADTFEFPQLSSDRACRAAAQRIVDRAKDPRQEGALLVPGDDPTFSVVEAIPTSIGNLLANRVETKAGETVINLASRESIEDLQQDLRNRLRAVSKQA